MTNWVMAHVRPGRHPAACSSDSGFSNSSGYHDLPILEEESDARDVGNRMVNLATPGDAALGAWRTSESRSRRRLRRWCKAMDSQVLFFKVRERRRKGLAATRLVDPTFPLLSSSGLDSELLDGWRSGVATKPLCKLSEDSSGCVGKIVQVLVC